MPHQAPVAAGLDNVPTIPTVAQAVPKPVRLADIPPLPEIPKSSPPPKSSSPDVVAPHGLNADLGLTPPPPKKTQSPPVVEARAVDADHHNTATPSVSDGRVTLPFPEDVSKLSEDAKPGLKALATRMNQNPDIRVQVLAYASGTEATVSKARRLSLARAVAVRTFLTDQDVPSTRIELRALGNHVKDEPADRVDVVIISQ
ncbi:MAG: OmpA family protein [Alphaproteobacteria bacterium]|nr:OmpA family protein [Alphaproteobacteria bacterium]